MKDKIKSYSFWTALSGAVVVFVNALGKCFGFAVQDELISGLIMAVAGLLVVFGIVTMPSNSETNTENKNEESESSEQENTIDKNNLEEK